MNLLVVLAAKKYENYDITILFIQNVLKIEFFEFSKKKKIGFRFFINVPILRIVAILQIFLGA